MTTYLKLPDKEMLSVEKLRSLWKFSEDEMRDKDFQTNNDLRYVILLQMVGAANRIVSSVVGQIDGGSFYNFEMLLRPLVEGLINYKYIKEDDTQMRARAFIIDDIKVRMVNVRKIIENTHSHLYPPLEIEEFRKLLVQLEIEQQEMVQTYGEDNLNFYSLHRRAELSETFDLYITLYWLLCQDTHLTCRGLDKFLKLDNQQLRIIWDLDLELIANHIQAFYTIFLALLNECSEVFRIPEKNKLNEFPIII